MRQTNLCKASPAAPTCLPAPCATGPGPGPRPARRAAIEFRRVGRLAAGGFHLLRGGLLVDLVGRNGPIGQQRDDIVHHLDEAALDVETLDLVAVADPHFAVAQPPDQRRVARPDADFAVEKRHGDEIGRRLADGLLGSDDDTVLVRPWCQIPDFIAATSPPRRSSSPARPPARSLPTYMKASSGRWSHLPSAISSKLRIVSASGVISPGLP